MRYLVDGCYGDGNIGDECLLEAMCRLIRREDPNADIRVMSSDPIVTAKEHALPAIDQCNPFGRNLYGSLAKGLLWKTFQEIRRCHVFVLGGGELFRDSTGISATLGMFYRMYLARVLGKQVVALGVGAQQPTKWWGRPVLRSALLSADRQLFRDPSGMQVATQIAAGLKRASWAPDPVFSLPWHREEDASKDDNGDVHVGIAVKSLPACNPRHHAVHNILPDVLESALNVISDRYRLRVSLLPFSDADRGLADVCHERLANHQPRVIAAHQGALKDALSDLDGLIAVPLHASVFAFASGVPAVGVAYDAKVQRLYEHFGISQYCLSLDHLNVQRLAHRVINMLENRDGIRQQMLQNASTAGDEFLRLASQLLHEARSAVGALDCQAHEPPA